MTKKELRNLYIKKRSQLAARDMLRLNDLLLIRFQQYALEYIQCLMNYWPMVHKGEVNTHPLADYVSFLVPALQLIFPVMDMRLKMLQAYAVNDETQYLENSYGIMEPIDGRKVLPVEIDVVFVPLLAFDEQGYRVGYGHGFYDRFLKTCRNDTLKIGFSFFEPQQRIEDVHEFDVPLNICITPNTIYEF